MSHHHSDHDHGHHHHGDAATIGFDAKLGRILEHWHRHNEDHLQGYRQWADDAEAHGHADVAAHLQAVLDLSRQIGERLQEARRAMEKEA